MQASLLNWLVLRRHSYKISNNFYPNLLVDNDIPHVTEIAAETIGSCGGIQDILAAMRAYPGNADLMSACCNALWSLTVNGMINLDFDCITITCIIGLYRLFFISVNRERGGYSELRQSMQDYD